MINASKVVALIIHLDRAVERRSQVEKIAASIPYEAEVISAVDGPNIDPSTMEFAQHAPRYPFDLSQNEIACFHSHRLAWQRIVEGGWDFGLVMEDDLTFDMAMFERALGLATKNATVDDFVRFPIKVREKPGEVIGVDGLTRLFKPSAVATSCVCQLVGRNAAKRLLSASNQIDRPVDAYIQLTWITGVEPLSVIPSGVSEISVELGGTTIHKSKKTLWSDLKREADRISYRLRLRYAGWKNQSIRAGHHQ